MKLKNVLTRNDLESFARTILEDISPDFVYDVFQDLHEDPDRLITFEDIDFSEDDELVSALADLLGNTACEESD
jgi:hypothetical protein